MVPDKKTEEGGKVNDRRLILRGCPRCKAARLPSEFFSYSKMCKSCYREHYLEIDRDKRESAKLGRITKGAKSIHLGGRIDGTPVIREIIKHMLINPKIAGWKLAKKVGISEKQLDDYMQTNHYLRAMRVVARISLNGFIPLALRSLGDTLESRSDEVKLKAAVRVLESENVMGPTKVDVNVNDLSSLPVEKLNEIIERSRLVPDPNPVMIEAEVVGG